jgi:hypothetical protein
MAKSEPSRNPSFSPLYGFEAPEKKKSAARWEAASLTACAIGAFIGLHCQKRILKTRIWLGSIFGDYRQFKLKYDVEDGVKENISGLWAFKGHQGL